MKPHLVINAYENIIAQALECRERLRQKFPRLLQNEDESISSWETRIRNQASLYEYENFADELMRDQFIAG